MSTIQAYPLQWPTGWKRATQRREARFRKASRKQGDRWIPQRDLTIAEAMQRVLQELERMGLGREDVVVSTNLVLRLDGQPRSGQSEPPDPGCAVYWRDDTGATKVMAIDLYDRVADNIAAVAATLDAMRAIERHGGATVLERAYTGFTALPAPGPSSPRDWWDVLECRRDSSLDVVREQYRRLRSQHHPDRGGDPVRFAAVEAAWVQAQEQR